MADLTAGQVPKYANVRTSQNVADISASANTVTLGVDTNGATAYTAGSAGSDVTSLIASTNDTVAVNVFIWILNGSNVKPLGIVNVPLSSGNAASVPSVDLIASIPGLPLNAQGKRYIPLYASEVLRVGALANLTAAKHCYVTALGSDYQ
jgi:hypothetical protein